jgi:DNA-binding NarL/FixJ family response regulator
VTATLSGAFEVVGTASDGLGAVELTTNLSPDILVLDIAMPLVNGIEAARRLKELGSRTRIVFLSVTQDPDFVEAAFDAGASCYVSKSFLGTDLIPAMWASMHGDTFVSPSIPSTSSIYH